MNETSFDSASLSLLAHIVSMECPLRVEKVFFYARAFLEFATLREDYFWEHEAAVYQDAQTV
jgi:hypothetical protein